MYCGRKLHVKDKYACSKGRCPSCRHIIFIPKRDRVDKVLAGETDNYKMDWSKFSDEQIAEMLELDIRSRVSVDDPEAVQKIFKQDLRIFLPSYDEITLFTLSFAFLSLYLMSGQLREGLYRAVIILQDIRIIIVALLSAAGMFLSFANVFFKREKYDFERYLMLFFAVIITAGTGIYSGFIIFEKSKGLLLIFPIWNFVNGVILLLFLRFGMLDIEECIVEKGVNFFQVLVSIASVGIILGLCHYIFKMHWVISYSICACYTITVNDAIQKILGINRIHK